MSATTEQRVALGEEVRTSIRLIQAGLGHLQLINGANDFYHLPILLLASGFERLMKTTLCFHVIHKTGSYPGPNYFTQKGRGHNLVWLRDKVVSDCFSSGYLKRPAASQDKDYISTEPLLLGLIEALSSFGQGGRYYNLDVALGKQPVPDSPERTWMQHELDPLKDQNDWFDQLKQPANLERVKERITTGLVIRFERFARALCRLFTLSDLADEAKRHTGTIKPFLFLMDRDLGTVDYRNDLGGQSSSLPT